MSKLQNENVIYTALFGDYDRLLNPTFHNNEIDYICFTDNKKIKSNFWKFIYICDEESPIYLNRKIKILTHKFLNNYQKSIYIDSNVILSINPEKLFEFLDNFDIALLQHPQNFKIIDELRQNLFQKNIDINIYKKILKRHSNYIFFNNHSRNVITNNRIIIRRHNNKNIINLMNSWWNEFLISNSLRDQLSLPFVINKKTKLKIITSKNNFFEFYYIRPHRNHKLLLKLKIFLRYYLKEQLLRIKIILNKDKAFKI